MNFPNMPYIPDSRTQATYLAAKYNDVKNTWADLENKYNELLKEVGADEDIAVSVFLFSGNEISVAKFECSGPNLLIVHGILCGNQVTAYIHQSCLQVVFGKVAKKPNASRVQFGFSPPDKQIQPALDNDEVQPEV